MSAVQWFDKLVDKYPAGYIEVFCSASIQVLYLVLGLAIERIRPTYASRTSRKMVRESLQNHLLATMVHVAYVVAVGGKSALSRTFEKPYHLPSWREVVSDMVVALLLRDAVFYLIHRLWHVPGVYERVHAKHHRIRSPGDYHVWTISYMGFVDFLFLYGFPVVLVAKVLEMNIATTGVFALVSAMGDQVQLVREEDGAHDEHHMDGSVNFGVYGFMDGLLGTGSGTKQKVAKLE